MNTNTETDRRTINVRHGNCTAPIVVQYDYVTDLPAALDWINDEGVDEHKNPLFVRCLEAVREVYEWPGIGGTYRVMQLVDYTQHVTQMAAMTILGELHHLLSVLTEESCFEPVLPDLR